MHKPILSDYTEADFLRLVSGICNAQFDSEKEQVRAVLLFEELTEHPHGSDMIYYADSDEEATPEAIVSKVKEWRAANGKPDFKPE
ncbi:bacteriocin immunity protein [Pseudomonas sp. TH06]|uniref:bacteriocin immunity protein n=1 Tax=Pseudomonas sp. TH06 TaxID=2796372 RepID=UPI0019147097|nr:bacteriocin immunity protein [Pseudomonas sp. TH06]MBK5530546.1 bacteriocin immunity protein [Pseudomonas sp. TH06]